MKLSDIEKTSSTTINNKMREKLGWSLNLEAMTVRSANNMMESIDNKLSAVRSSHKIHASQNDPNYVGMIMAKQVLESYVAEAKKPDADSDGVPDWADKKPGKDDNASKGKKGEMSDKQAKFFGKKKVSEAELNVDEKAVSKSQQQAAAIAMHAPKSNLKGASKEMSKMPKKELEKFASTKHKGLPEKVDERKDPDKHRKLAAEYQKLTGKKAPAGTSTQSLMIIVDKAKRAKKVNESRLFEDELGQAQAMLAAKDMVDSMQDMIEDLSKMLNEQLPPLTDSIRTAIGSAEADSFKAAASSTLSSLLTTVQSSREAMDQAVRTLSGEPGAVTVPGGAPSSDMTDLGGGDEIGLPDEEDDFAASDAAVGGDLPLGREKR